MEPFEYFEVTADVGIVARGKSLEELFENSARAMFGVMVNLEKVKPAERIEFEVDSTSLEELLLDYLTHLLGLKDIYSLFFSQFEVKILEYREGFKLQGSARGEERTPEHEVETEVKAVTYHLMEIKKNKNWRARFVVDV